MTRLPPSPRSIAEAKLAMAEHNLAEMRSLYHELLERYHALAMRLTPAVPTDPAQLTFPEPEGPPDEVLAAIQFISPTRDKTYEANWQYWERNKARAKEHPKAFADEIIKGGVYEVSA